MGHVAILERGAALRIRGAAFRALKPPVNPTPCERESSALLPYLQQCKRCELSLGPDSKILSMLNAVARLCYH